MSMRKIPLPFNPDTMPISDAKTAVKCLSDLFHMYDMFGETDPEEFALRVAQVRDRYEIRRNTR